jgi:hypothetical protein
MQQARRAASRGRRVFVPAHDAFRRGGDNRVMAASPNQELLRWPRRRSGREPGARMGWRALIVG